MYRLEMTTETMTGETARRMVAEAYSLESLEAALEAIAEFCDQAIAGDRFADSDADWVDYSSLPNYGGEEPDDTSCVWSWDETRLLVGECQPFRIVDREEVR